MTLDLDNPEHPRNAHTGVYRTPNGKRWRVSFRRLRGHSYYGGTFDTLVEANNVADQILRDHGITPTTDLYTRDELTVEVKRRLTAMSEALSAYRRQRGYTE